MRCIFKCLTWIKGSKCPLFFFDLITNIPGRLRVLAKDPDSGPPKSAGLGPGPGKDPLQVWYKPLYPYEFLLWRWLVNADYFENQSKKAVCIHVWVLTTNIQFQQNILSVCFSKVEKWDLPILIEIKLSHSGMGQASVLEMSICSTKACACATSGLHMLNWSVHTLGSLGGGS